MNANIATSKRLLQHQESCAAIHAAERSVARGQHRVREARAALRAAAKTYSRFVDSAHYSSREGTVEQHDDNLAEAARLLVRCEKSLARAEKRLASRQAEAKELQL